MKIGSGSRPRSPSRTTTSAATGPASCCTSGGPIRVRCQSSIFNLQSLIFNLFDSRRHTHTHPGPGPPPIFNLSSLMFNLQSFRQPQTLSLSLSQNSGLDADTHARAGVRPAMGSREAPGSVAAVGRSPRPLQECVVDAPDRLPHAEAEVSRTQGPVVQRAQLSEPKDPQGPKRGRLRDSRGKRGHAQQWRTHPRPGAASMVSSAGQSMNLRARR